MVHSRWVKQRQHLLGLVLVLCICAFLCDKKLWRPTTIFRGQENVQISEAQAWWNGRLALPDRVHDTALYSGRPYSHFPPLFTFVAACFIPFFAGVPHLAMVMIVATVPILAFETFVRVTDSVFWGGLFALGLVCGTSAWPVLRAAAAGGAPYPVNHALAMIGLLLVACELFGRKRVWPAALGLMIAGFSRQMTMLFAPAVLYLAWRGQPSEVRVRRVAVAAGACVLVIGIYCALNTLKFGHPLRTGYLLIYEGRDDSLARDARSHGLFSWHWVPRNLYYANLGFPQVHKVTVAGNDILSLKPNLLGTGIWWTSPVLLWVFILAGRHWRDPNVSAPLGCVLAIFTALLFFHATGALQRGFNRFSLDYIPVMMVMVAPTAVSGPWRWLTAIMLGWGVFYFVCMLSIPVWRV